MTARSIGSATIAFGLVSIPVKLYTTKGEERKISLNMLHDPEACAAAKPLPEGVTTAPASRLKQQYVCTVCEQEVDSDHTVKGFEHAKGQYVVVPAADIEALDLESTNRIEIETFVERGEVDPLYVEASYYLAPDKGAEIAYDILREALYGQAREGLARYAAKGREHLVLVRLHPVQPILVLHQLRYQHEVKDAGEVPMDFSGTSEPSDELRALAAKLVIERAGGFEPSIYEDKSHLRMKALIEAKIAGGQIVAVSPPSAPATTLDLMSALRMSVKEQPAAPAPVAPKRTRSARASSAARKKAKPVAKKRQAIRKVGR